MFLTTRQWADLNNVSMARACSWIANGHVKYERQGGKRMVRADHPVPCLVPPDGYVSIPEFCRINGVPEKEVRRLVNEGVIPHLPSTCKKRWIAISFDISKVQVAS